MLNKAFSAYKDSFRGFSREVWLLSVVMLINRSGTMVIPFLSVYLTQVKHFSFIQAGWVMSCFGAGSVLGSYIGGKLTDKIGYYSVQFWSLFLSGLAFIGLSFMDSLLSICVMVFIASTIADAFRPANFAAIAVYSSNENRTRAIALLRLAINLGWAVGPAAGGIIAAQLGYHWLFWVDGLTCMSAALYFRYALKERQVIPTTNKEENVSEERPKFHTSVWKDHAFLFFLIFVLLNGIAFMQLFSTLPVFFKHEVLINEASIGRLMAMNGLVIAIIEMPLIFVIEKRFKSWQLISVGTLLIGLSFLIFNIFGNNLGASIACMLLLTLGEILSLPFIATVAMAFTSDKNRGQYMALFTMTYSISHIIAPNVGMQLAERFSFDALWWVIMLMCVLCWIGFRTIGNREKRAFAQVV